MTKLKKVLAIAAFSLVLLAPVFGTMEAIAGVTVTIETDSNGKKTTTIKSDQATVKPDGTVVCQ